MTAIAKKGKLTEKELMAVLDIAHPDKDAISRDWLVQNPILLNALHAASEATKHITSEQERIHELANEATTDKELAARNYQIEYIEKYLTRASDIALKRVEHYSSLDTQSKINKELELIKSDKAYWFEMYAWGYDPRARTPLAVVPFELFPKQQEMIKWLDEIVFKRRTSGLIEKSRDEGATETIVRWGLHNWLFTEGFSMLLSTRKEDEVDSKKNTNTLFERIRFQIRLLPTWQHPEGFDIDRSMLSSMKLANPENGNTLLGEAPVENMGRGGRVTCAMLDEFAFWSFSGYPQYRSLSQTTDSILMPSSVAGRLNQYADIAYDGVTSKFIMDWRENPFKDKRWYDALPYGYISPKMSRTTIAQEIDRNYDAAQPGKVWHPKEEFVFITESEFLKPFEKEKLRHRFFDHSGCELPCKPEDPCDAGKFKIPDDWRVIRTHDYGKSEGHEWAYLLGAQPRANYPLSDTHFVFVARDLEPTGLATEKAVELWTKYERRLGLRDKKGNWLHRPYMSYNSHEQKKLRGVLFSTYGESWVPWLTDYDQGIEEIEDWWTPIDKEKRNPYRPELYGRCRLIFVAPDDEYELAYNPDLAQHFVTTSKSERGFGTARAEIADYHYPEWELGKPRKVMRPVKEFDDLIDCIRGYAVNWNRKPEELTSREELEKRIDEKINFKPQAIEIMTPAQDVSKQMARLFAVQEMKKEGYSIDRDGNEVEPDWEEDWDDISEGW